MRTYKLPLLMTLLTLLTGAVSAGPADNPELERWLKKSITLCPDPIYDFVTVDVPGPRNFEAYRITTESQTTQCRDIAYALYAPESGQILSGQVIPLPPGEGPITERLEALLEQRMEIDLSVRTGEAVGEDGVRSIVIEKSSPAGIVPIQGWVTGDERFFVLGKRGNIMVDPGRTLVDALGAGSGASRGPSNAQIRIVELSDLQCPACMKAHELVEPIIREHEGKVHYTRLDLPITDNHDWTMKAAMAAEAIRELDESVYWQFIDYIFANQPNISLSNIDQFVNDFVDGNGIDKAQFAKLASSPALRERLNEQTGAAFSNGIFGTPTFIVNGRMIFYGRGADNVEAYLRGLLE